MLQVRVELLEVVVRVVLVDGDLLEEAADGGRSRILLGLIVARLEALGRKHLCLDEW